MLKSSKKLFYRFYEGLKFKKVSILLHLLGKSVFTVLKLIFHLCLFID